jgi:hypothetical protein
MVETDVDDLTAVRRLAVLIGGRKKTGCRCFGGVSETQRFGA